MALMPEVRVNKNGVPVIKHVNPDKTSAAMSQTTIPAPSVAPDEDLSHIQWLITSALRSSNKHKRECDLMRTFLHPDTLRVLQARMAESQFIYNVTSTLIHRSLEDGTFVHLNNLMVVLDGIPANEQPRSSSLQDHVTGLQARERGTKKDWSKKDKSEWEKPQAIVKAIQLLDQIYLDHRFVGSGRFIRSQELERLILERPRDAERIAAVISERKLPVDTEDEIALLIGLLDQPTASAISRGLL
jgi:hypothetical protein